MKIQLSVSEEKIASVKKQLTEHGIEIAEDAEYLLTEAARCSPFLSARDMKKEHVRLSPSEIIFIEAFGKDIEIHTMQETYYAQERMYELEAALNPRDFLRISKSVIISRKHVQKIRPSLSMKYVLTLSDGTLVDVTRSYYHDFKKFFQI